MLLQFQGIIGKGHASKPEASKAIIVREFTQTLCIQTGRVGLQLAVIARI